MMRKGEAHETIRRLNTEHEHDHDGGSALVEALKQAQKQVEPDQRALFAEALADFVRAYDYQLWAVALETLVQLGESVEVASLGKELALSNRDEKWKDNVVLGLLRLGQDQFRDALLSHARSSLENPRTLTVPIIAALCRIDRGTCLEISSSYFTSAHDGGREHDVEGFIPAFVRHFMAVDDHLLAELARKVAARDPATGRWLARCLNEYLSKPWILEELGDARSTSIRAEISEATHSGN